MIKILTQRENHISRCPYREEFYRDYTRILHSRAFRRLRHKTQVFIAPQSDHICTRMEHSLIVASLARTVCRALNKKAHVRISEDLAVAIALGHDIGHAPFGHWGEDVLDECLGEDGVFKHEIQSIRVVDLLESPYDEYGGLNLTLAVRDGIALHCGEQFDRSLKPKVWQDPESWRNFLRTLRSSDNSAAETWKRAVPGTLEGCIVRFVDKIAYIGRDLEDAIEHTYPPLISTEEALAETHGPWWQNGRFRNRAFIDACMRDLIESSTCEEIRFSENMYQLVKNVYETPEKVPCIRAVDGFLANITAKGLI